MFARRMAWRSALLAMVAVAFLASLPGSQAHKNSTGGWHKNSKYAQLRNDTNVTTATLALQSLGLKSSIPDGSTIFAPSDSAFLLLAKILNATTPAALLSGPSANYSTAVLKYHVIPGKVIHSYDLKTNTSVNATTLLGKLLTIKKASDGDVWVCSPYPPTLPTGLKERLAAKKKERQAQKDSKDGSHKEGKDSKKDWGKKMFAAKVVKADIPWGSSVVHVIDKVLLPPL